MRKFREREREFIMFVIFLFLMMIGADIMMIHIQKLGLL